MLPELQLQAVQPAALARLLVPPLQALQVQCWALLEQPQLEAPGAQKGLPHAKVSVELQALPRPERPVQRRQSPASLRQQELQAA